MTKSHRASEKTNQPVDAPTHLHGKRGSSTQQQQQQLRTTGPPLLSPLSPLSAARSAWGLSGPRAGSVGGVACFGRCTSCVCVCVCVSTPRASSQSFFFWKQHHIPLPYTKKVYAIKSPMEADAARLFGICDQSPMEADLARFFSSSPPTAPVSCDDLTSHRLSSRERRGEQGRLPPASALLADSAACLVTEALAPTELRCPKIERPEKLLEERRVVLLDFFIFPLW